MGVGNFENEKVDVILNRDMMVNESAIIADVKNSVGILSTETLIAQHPWTDDPDAELKRLKKEQEEQVEEMQTAFRQTGSAMQEEGAEE